MRDPQRIPVVLAKLGEIWLKHPDLRLGQLIVNGTLRKRNDGVRCPQVFSIEDEELLRGIEEMFNDSGG